MGKSNNKKDKKRKDQSVFKVAGVKVNKNAKNKTKAVTSNLKKMIASTKNKTEKVDKTAKQLSMEITGKKQQKVKPAIKKKSSSIPEPVDMDTAIEEMAKL